MPNGLHSRVTFTDLKLAINDEEQTVLIRPQNRRGLRIVHQIKHPRSAEMSREFSNKPLE
jgi:hypothetical protein